MFARVSTYKGDTERLVDGFRRTTEPLTQLEGFERAYFLTDAAAGRAVTVTLWDSPAAMAASAEWASKAREHAAHESGAVVESVGSYEVALTAERRQCDEVQRPPGTPVTRPQITPSARG